MSGPLFNKFRRDAIVKLQQKVLRAEKFTKIKMRRYSVTAWTQQDLNQLVRNMVGPLETGTKPEKLFRREKIKDITSRLVDVGGSGGGGGGDDDDDGGTDDRAGINLPSDATEEQWRQVVALKKKFAGRQRELASAAVTWAAENYPDSIASYIAQDFATVVSYVGNTAAAQIGDYFLGDLVNLCALPTVEGVIRIVTGETTQWLNTPGIAGWFGSMMDAQGRLSTYVERIGLEELGFQVYFDHEGNKKYSHPEYPDLELTLKNV